MPTRPTFHARPAPPPLRSRTARVLVTACVAFCLSGCEAPRRREPGSFEAVWKQYSSLPEHRALALAGDRTRDRWVVGMAAGAASSESAEKAALAECGRQRQDKRMRDRCEIYAVGPQRVRDRDLEE